MLCLHVQVPAQKIKGSDTCLPVIQREMEEYLKRYPQAKISITGGGSGVGIAGIRERSTDLAMISRKVSLEEKYMLKNSHITLVEKVFAYDALAIIVHPSNPISQLTRQQVEDIYCGRITNWSEIGGANSKIIVYSRETSSGTHEFFKEMLLLNKNYAATVLNLPASGAIVQSVSQTPGAIAYLGLAYLNTSKIKAVDLSMDGINYIKPTVDNALNHSYPFVRPLYLCYDSANLKRVNSFIDFIMSEHGQDIVRQVGYVPLYKKNQEP